MRKDGLDYDLIERRGVSHPQGYSVTLPPAGLDALRTLGIYESIAPLSAPVDGVLLASEAHGATRSIDFGRNRLQVRTVRRADLHAALLATLAQPVRYNTAIGSCQASEDGVTVELTTDKQASYRLVVGADGLHSHIRTLMSPSAQASPTGVAFWTCFIPKPLHTRFSTTHITQYWQHGHFAGIFPLPGGANIVLSTHLPATIDLRDIDISQLFGNMSPDIDAVLANIDRNAMYQGHLHEVKLAHWQRYPYVLVGDAAHAMMPATGMGSTAGILDAITLTDALVRHHDTHTALKSYEASRVVSSKRAQTTSRLITEAMLSTGIAETINQKAVQLLPDSFFVRIFR